jgi:hypothetical protein
MQTQDPGQAQIQGCVSHLPSGVSRTGADVQIKQPVTAGLLDQIVERTIRAQRIT